MGVQDVEQPFGELRVIVVEALRDAGGDQGHRLDQALDMGIFADVAGNLQFSCHLGVAAGELAAEKPQLHHFKLVGLQ